MVVPTVVFCGACGAALDSTASRWRILLRPKTYAAAPTQPVYIPRISSSIFPRLPARATRAYRVSLVVLMICMVVMSALQWNIPAATISVLGVPLLFMLYAWEAHAFSDDRRRMIVAVVSGAVIGLAWWWFSADFMSRRYGVTTAAAQALQNTIVNEGLAITLIGAVLMVLPLPLIRLIPVAEFDSLDGFVVGAAAALAHLTVSYVVWWMPQIVAGLINAQTTTPARMLQDTITYGVVDPLTTIALGGMVGVALWFRTDPAAPQPGRARAAVILCAVITAVVYAVVWGVDAKVWVPGVELGFNLALTVLALLALRIGLQIALLHEKRGTDTGAPMLCVYCEKVVPDMAFCPACGAAALASSRTSRRIRRDCPPVPVT
jgi:hypothetical protein